MSYLERAKKILIERDPVYPWRKLHPNIDVREWEIVEDHRGVFGRKIRGGDSGLIAFYVPRGWRPATKGRKGR